MADGASLQELFIQAIDRPVEQRAAFLEGVADHDPKLHAELSSLLEFHDSEQSAGSGSSSSEQSAERRLRELELTPGDTVGPYEVVEKLGEGGFAVVYLGRQREPVSRRIALKLIKPGMDTQSVLARFSAEQQALALMSHDGITRVIDQGVTADGRPWFAMEYVKGEPIDLFCDSECMSIPDRLRLFIDVCHAVHHAHLRGVIHRDLKPNNILVSRDPKTGALSPKVIDFGIAKALGAELSDQTVITRMGQLIGTPEFMSPEQAVMSPTDIDTRSDVFALGILLYKLLSGVLPRSTESFRGIGFADVHRLIASDSPARMASRFEAFTESEQKATALARGTSSKSLAALLHGELGWVPLKAMQPEKVDRYGSAESLAGDIERFLDGRALIAGPQSVFYRVRKVLAKNRTVAFLSFCIVLLLILTSVSTTILLLREQRALADSERNLQTANATLDALNRIAVSMEPEFVLNRLVDNFSPEFMEPILDPTLDPDSDRMLRADVASKNFLSTFIYDPIIEQVAELIELGEYGPAKSLSQRYSKVAWQAGVQDSALELTQLSMEAHRKDSTLTPATLASLNDFLANIYTFQGELDKALEVHRATISAIESDPPAGEMSVRLWYSLNNIAHVHSLLGQFDESIDSARRAKQLAQQVNRSDLVSWSSYTLSQLLDSAGLYDEAYLEAVSDNHNWLESVRTQPEFDHGGDTLSFVRGVAHSAGKSGRLELSLELWTILCEARKQLHRPASMPDLAIACEQKAEIAAALALRDQIPVAE